jgi:hypothetical protein
LQPRDGVTFLFAVIVLVGIGVVGFLAYYGGALLSRPKQPAPMPRAQFLVMPTMPSLPPPSPPTRMARGTTPQPLSHDTAPYVRAESPVPNPNDASYPIPGVISNRDDQTERNVLPDDRFSVRRSRPKF